MITPSVAWNVYPLEYAILLSVKTKCLEIVPQHTTYLLLKLFERRPSGA